MGTFFHPLTLVGAAGARTLEALVDTGASLTMLPAPLLEELGFQAHRTARLRLADGRRVEWRLGRVLLRLDGMEESDLCIFGEPGAPAVIGAHTLETFLLTVDPVEHRLVPREGLLL